MTLPKRAQLTATHREKHVSIKSYQNSFVFFFPLLILRSAPLPNPHLSLSISSGNSVYAVAYVPKGGCVTNDCLECNHISFVCFPEQENNIAYTEDIIITQSAQHLNHQGSAASTAHMG